MWVPVRTYHRIVETKSQDHDDPTPSTHPGGDRPEETTTAAATKSSSEQSDAQFKKAAFKIVYCAVCFVLVFAAFGIWYDVDF